MLRQKDLILLPYPFTDQGGSKVRPAIIVSNEEFNKKCPDFIVVPLTSVIKDEPYSLIINQENMQEGELIKQSRARLDKIFTIDKDIIIMKIGRLNEATFNKIKQEISKIFN